MTEVREGDLLAGKYRVERTIGQGGMGVVYLAMHVELDQHVAVKLMLPETAKSADAVTRFMREARAAAKIKSQHVVRVHDVGVLDGTRPYMAMEYLRGSDLHKLLTERKRLPVAEVAEYLLQALEALAEAHAAGIVHRDLKPGNLFVTRRPDDTPIVKVLDFGISKIQASALSPSNPLTQVSALVGSPLYMSPEQMKASRDIDQRADIWALGIILHELLTGEVPFKGESLPELCAVIVLEADPPRARDLVPELPPAIDEVIARCLSRKLEERYANAAELARALVPFAHERARVSVDRIAGVLGPAGSVRGTTLAQSAPRAPESASGAAWSGTTADRRGRRGTLVLAAAGAVLALAGIAAFALRGGSPAAATVVPATSPVTTEAAPREPAAAATVPPAAAPTSTVTAGAATASATTAAPPSTAPVTKTPKATAKPARTPRTKPEDTSNPFGGRR